MTSISLNTPCPCGSGKKYKRCCIDKINIPKVVLPVREHHTKSILSPLDEYSTKELLKVFALLQLYPENHGKNIRIEEFVTYLVTKLSQTEANAPINYNTLQADILKTCKRSPHEDPPEEFFTENIVFINGNNIVYPGIATNGTEIVQHLINVLLSTDTFPKEFMKEVMPGVLLILHLHTELAKRFGYTRRMFKEERGKELHVPPSEDIKASKDYFAFSFTDIKNICDQLNIPYSTLDHFVFRWDKKKLDFIYPDENPLFQQPFVFIDGDFILTLPTSELLCLNEFIIRTAKKHHCISQLVNMYADEGRLELTPNFWKMNWQPLAFNVPKDVNATLPFVLAESLWRFDNDKIAYVTVITEDPTRTQIGRADIEIFSKHYAKRIKEVNTELEKSYPGDKKFLLNFTHKIRVLALFGLALRKEEGFEQNLHTTLLILHVLMQNWRFDQLTLWKYAKYLNLAEESMHFMPLNTHLSKFDYYKNNHDSFYHSDNEPYKAFLFGFEIESEVRRKGIAKLDKIGVSYLMDNQFGYLQCYRKETHYPVYVSQEINVGLLRSCLLKYTCPVWAISVRKHDFKAETYINGILYWLNELYPEAKFFIDQLGELPITFAIDLDASYYKIEALPADPSQSTINYSVDARQRSIRFHIPIELAYHFASEDNNGERILMTHILRAIGELIITLGCGTDLTTIDVQHIIDLTIPLGLKKMITIATGDRDLKISDVDLESGRKIQGPDVSYILQNQTSWLKYGHKIPKEVGAKADKIKILNDLVGLHFHKVTEMIQEYEFVSLLDFLMRRHEALIQKRAFRKLNYPVRQACYSHYYDVLEEFSKTETDLNEANLCMRVLIEFTACLKPSGTKKPNEDDVDMMLAHLAELIGYGSTSDEIAYDIQDPTMGLLPSGRLGISKEYHDTTLRDFKQQIFKEEFDSYSEGFGDFFHRESPNQPTEQLTSYMEKVNETFKKEWGIGLFDLHSISNHISSELLHSQQSVALLKEDEMFNLIQKQSDFEDKEIHSFIRQLCFINRESILTPPEGYNKVEIFPWRYNRRLSYLSKPLVPVYQDGAIHYMISARHLHMATENIISLFFSGTLKVNIENKGIQKLLSERNNIKGRRYREKVYNWLKENTSLEVFKDEIKIASRGFFIAETDKGDIDILAIDHERKVIYSIECKNTSQSKVPYEFKSEIDTYLGAGNDEGLIQKHVNRHEWLEQNRGQVLTKLGLNDDFKMKSLVISKHILTLTHLRTTPIPIFSYYDLKTGKLSFDSYCS